MHSDGRLIVIAFCALLAVPTLAEAKDILVGPFSRAVLKSACDRARGVTYGINHPDEEYGCGTGRAQVKCAADESECHAAVPDTSPMTGTGLNLILGTDLAPSGRPVKIQPQDARITGDDNP